MKCLLCNGKMEPGRTTFQVTRKGYHLTLDSVPAWVCAQCGETFFDEEQTEALQTTLQALDVRTQELAHAG
jgi:YgiT-type zinc finger domain-containing protein